MTFEPPIPADAGSRLRCLRITYQALARLLRDGAAFLVAGGLPDDAVVVAAHAEPHGVVALRVWSATFAPVPAGAHVPDHSPVVHDLRAQANAAAANALAAALLGGDA